MAKRQSINPIWTDKQRQEYRPHVNGLANQKHPPNQPDQDQDPRLIKT